MVDPVWPVGAMIPPEFRKEMRSYAEKFTQVLCLELERLGHQAKGVAIEGAPSVSHCRRNQEDQPRSFSDATAESIRGEPVFSGQCFSHSVVHHTDCSLLLVRG